MTIDFEKLTKVADWFFAKATVATVVCAALGCLVWVVTTAAKLPYFKIPDAAHHTLDDLGLRSLIFSLLLAALTIIVELRKNRKQNAAVSAEQIRRNPDITDSSTIPAVQEQIIKQAVDGAPTA